MSHDLGTAACLTPLLANNRHSLVAACHTNSQWAKEQKVGDRRAIIPLCNATPNALSPYEAPTPRPDNLEFNPSKIEAETTDRALGFRHDWEDSYEESPVPET